MDNYIKEIEALFDLYEEEKLTEAEIINRCIDLVKDRNFNRDFMFDLNDTIYNRGYSFQFDVPQLEREKFDLDKYVEITTNVGKSALKTKNLIEYLNEISDFRLYFASLHMLRIKHLQSLGYLTKDNEYINMHLNCDLRTLLFKSFEENKVVKDILLSTLKKIGLKYINLDYMQFRLDIEYLLWTIEKKDINNGFIKVNTLKVALNIAPKEFFIRGEKVYYNCKFSDVTKKYLRLVDKNAFEVIYSKYGDLEYIIDGTGYELLYLLLKK